MTTVIPHTTLALCNCGERHRVPSTWVGEHDWWKCTYCLEADHREFEEFLRAKQIDMFEESNHGQA